MVHLAPVKQTITAADTARLYWNTVGKLHGIPRSIVSDRDPRFVSKFWCELWKILGSSLRMSSAYHPQTDGQTEAMNRWYKWYSVVPYMLVRKVQTGRNYCLPLNLWLIIVQRKQPGTRHFIWIMASIHVLRLTSSGIVIPRWLKGSISSWTGWRGTFLRLQNSYIGLRTEWKVKPTRNVGNKGSVVGIRYCSQQSIWTWKMHRSRSWKSGS